MALNLGERMKIYLQVPTFSIKPQIWRVHVGFFADDGKEMDKNEKCTCRACKAIVFSLEICKFVTFSLPSPLSLLKLPNREFKICDATVTKTSFKIATSSQLIFFVIVSACPTSKN